MSLDVARGMAVAMMLFVEQLRGNGFPSLRHATWVGLTWADIVFPCFMFLAGCSLAVVTLRVPVTGNLIAMFVRRALNLFAVGLVFNAFSGGGADLSTLRIPGVLQRIGVCYLCASAIFLRTGVRGQIGWIVGLLAGYAALLKFVPVPGYGAGHIDEAVGNLAWWIDSHVLAGHTWSGAPAPGFDPEGIISTLPAIATVLLGALAGRVLRAPVEASVRVRRLLGGGAAFAAAGLALHLWLPINKNLWTSSFTLFMAGWSSLWFAAFYWLIDVRGVQRWATPFVIYGMNAIVIFVGAGLVAKMMGLIAWQNAAGAKTTLKGWVYANGFTPHASPVNASLAFALAFVAAFLGLGWVLWRKRWFLKI